MFVVCEMKITAPVADWIATYLTTYSKVKDLGQTMPGLETKKPAMARCRVNWNNCRQGKLPVSFWPNRVIIL
jgi:hypothetical protein